MSKLLAILLGYLGHLRFPRLAVLTAVFFLADLIVPDLIPLADEIALGLLTALLGSWRGRRKENETGGEGSLKNVDPLR
jgi:hypothetical protein